MRSGSALHPWAKALLAAILAAGVAQAPGEDPTALARRILNQSGVQGGIIVHLGFGDGKLTAALRAGDGYAVQGLEADPAKVVQARDYLKSKGLYGPVSVEQFAGAVLPYTDNLINLVVVQNPGSVSMAEVMRVLAPGGAACVQRAGEWSVTRKAWPDNIDQWGHFLHDAGNNAVAKDSVVGPPRSLQWVAPPLWLRTHEIPSGIQACVSSGGRLYYLFDEGLIGIADERLPDRWSLLCRDASNGKLLGFTALKTGPGAALGIVPDEKRLEKGPAYGQVSEVQPSDADWPTYRHDPARSGSTRAAVPSDARIDWKIKLGGPLTAPVAAGGRVFVAGSDAHTLYALEASSGLLDGSWYNRTFWMYSKRWPGFQLANQAPKSGQLLVTDDEKTYAVGVFYRRNVHSPMFFPAREGYLLFADLNANEPQIVGEPGARQPLRWLPQSDYERGGGRGIWKLEQEAFGLDKMIGYTRAEPPVWTDWLPVRIRAMVKAGDTLFVAGAPDVLDPKDPYAAFEARKGGPPGGRVRPGWQEAVRSDSRLSAGLRRPDRRRRPAVCVPRRWHAVVPGRRMKSVMTQGPSS